MAESIPEELLLFTQNWRKSMEEMLDLDDETLAGKLSILFGAKRPAGERALKKMSDYYRQHFEDVEPNVWNHGEIRGFAGAARILCRTAELKEPLWIGKELDG